MAPAAPAPAEPTITTPPNARRNDKSDFGTEVVTGTFGPDVKTFTLHHGVRVSPADHAGDMRIELANDSLISLLVSVAKKNTDCPAPTPKPERKTELVKRTNELDLGGDDSSVGSVKRISIPEKRSPPVLENLDIGKCTLDRVRELLELMNQPGAAVNQLIVAGRDIAIPALADSIAERAEQLFALAQYQVVLIPLRENGRRMFATALTAYVLVRTLELGELTRETIVRAKNFNRQASNGRNCGKNEDAAACPDANCRGDPVTNKCLVEPNKGCECYPIGIIKDGLSFDPKFLAKQQEVLRPFAPAPESKNKPPKCNGLGTSTYAETRAIADAAKEFCGAGTIKADPKRAGLVKDYNKNSKNWIQLEMVSTKSFDMPASECVGLFKILSDGCDGNEPLFNPNNYKHGGSIEHPDGAILKITPKSGKNPICEPMPYEDKNWITRDAARFAATDLCHNHSLKHKARNRLTATTTVEKLYKIEMGILWTKDGDLNERECIDNFVKIAADGCAGNDPKNNPSNRKFRSTFLNDDGILFAIGPRSKLAEYPPNGKDRDGKVIEPKCDKLVSWKPKREEPLGEKTINAYCVDGKDYGVGIRNHYDIPLFGTRITTKEVDAEKTYQQGERVCRHGDKFRGKINAKECKEALKKISNRCLETQLFTKSNFVYNCVQYNVQIVNLDGKCKTEPGARCI
ncbi:hypothetical protein AJ80_03400 [Polytolypa hystricis UAMH7299]|uniref:Uncharacterized protein n=1 Tax=Polytolypa hystricis (strain UAMH7299) TaxID=1447883 RepID=A0A2B7YJW8_POLH7|nr:hypothetical protein AJ80_03400 [Polytolypa hystricis UAMH7299]